MAMQQKYFDNIETSIHTAGIFKLQIKYHSSHQDLDNHQLGYFMEDMTVKANTVIKGECTNVEMERVIRWDRMKFKPSKLTSLVIMLCGKAYL